jgi:hypothetical protein
MPHPKALRCPEVTPIIVDFEHEDIALKVVEEVLDQKIQF